MKIATVVGARPQFIKSAALSKAMVGSNIEEVLIHTGQHYDKNMSQVFFDELDIKTPKYSLNVGSGSHAEQTAKMMLGIEKALLSEEPDCVVLFGDTNSTLAGAIVAAKLTIPIAHVEAGLRCFLRYVPEEQNRIVADHLSAFNFTPSENGKKWLADEGITQNVFNFGDIMVDSLMMYSKKAEQHELQYYVDRLIPVNSSKPSATELANGWCFSTIHRQENTDCVEKIEEIFMALDAYQLPTVLPIHPRTRHCLAPEVLSKYKNIHFVEPLNYIDTLFFSRHAKAVVTDSGGLHKECYVMRVPSIVVAKNSCWAETFQGNWAVLAEPDHSDILEKLNHRHVAYDQWKPYYGDGNAAIRIVDVLKNSI